MRSRGETATYLEQKAERHARDKGFVANHGTEKGGTARLGVIVAEASVKGTRERSGGS